MTTVVSQIVVEMAANVARLQQDMNSAKGMVGGAMNEITRVTDIAKKALAALGVTASVAGFASMIKGAIESAAALHDLSQVTGVSASALSALTAVGRTTGTTAETLAGHLTKMAKNLVDVEKPSSNAGQALRALGIHTQDFVKLKPDEQMQAVAKAAEKFADGGGKAAAMEAILGKGAATLIPYMHDLAATTQLNATLTDEQAAAADALGDRLGELKGKVTDSITVVAMGMVPALRNAADAFFDVVAGTKGTTDATAKLARDNSLQNWTATAIRAVTYLMDIFSVLGRSLQTVGETIGQVAARAANFFSSVAEAAKRAIGGDFTGALNTMKTAMSQNDAILKDYGERVKSIWADPFIGKAIRDRIDSTKAVGAATAQAATEQVPYNDATTKGAAAAREHAKAQREVADAITATSVAQLELQKITVDQIKIHNAVLDQAIEEMKKAEEVQKAWEANADAVFQGLTDALYRAFEDGKGFAKAFTDTLKSTFGSLVLRPVIEAIVKPVSGALGSLTTGASSGISSVIGDSMSWISSGLGKMFGGSGTGMLSGISRMGGGAQTGPATGAGALSALGPWMAMAAAIYMMGDAMYNQGWTGGGIPGMSMPNMMKMMTAGYGLGGLAAPPGGPQLTAWGHRTLAPFLGDKTAAILSGSVLSSALFGYADPKVKAQGLDLTASGGNIEGSRYATLFYKGGVFRSNKTKTVTEAMGAELDASLSAQAADLFASMQGYARILGLPGDAMKAVTTSLKVDAGKEGDELAKAVDEFFTQYSDDLAATLSDSLKPFQKAGETLTATLQRLAALSTFSDSLNTLGGVFSRVAALSVDAKEELIGFAGGMDAFLAKAQSFVSGYYSEAEQAGIAARNVQAALKELGITGDVNSRSDFRKLVESQDLATSVGRETMSALLDVATAFGPVADYLSKAGGTLAQLADQAPQSEILQSMFEASASQTEIQTRTADGVDRVNQSVVSIGDQITTALETGLAAIADRMSSVEDAVARNGRDVVGAIEANT